jgi:hypothetical protein
MTSEEGTHQLMTADAGTMARPGSESSGGERWWRRPFSVFQTNLQEIDALMDVERVLDVIQEHGSDTWLINTGGIVSFYPTDLPFQTRNPFLPSRPSGDLIGDAVTAARSRGVRVIARLDFSKIAASIAREHPEWLFVSPDGQPQVYNTLFSTCPSGDYYQQRSLDVIDEVLDRYPVDAFFFNWMKFNELDYSRAYHGVCHCANCTAAFSVYSDEPLPSNPKSPTYPQWMRFAQESITTLSRRIADHIAARRPDTGLVLRNGAPILYSEANNAFGREFWPHATAEAISAHVSARPEIAALVNSVSFVDMPYRMAGEQPELFAQYLLQAIARGGNPSTYIMGAPGRIPYANLPLGREITRFHRAHRDLYARLRPAATTALVRPDRLRAAGPDGFAESTEEFRGAYTSLKETHHPFDVIAVEQIEKMAREEALSRYSLIILPDLGSLGASTAAALDAFVEAGGNLLVTGSSGLTGDGAVELAASPALMRVGDPLTGKALWSTFVTDQDQPDIGEYRYAGPVIPVFGSYTRYVWKPGAIKAGFVLPSAPYGPPEKCYGHTGSDDPAAVHARHGGGLVTVVPWSIGRTYREFGTSEVRDRFMTAVRSLARLTVSADLPEQVELIVGRDDDGGLVLHLINQSGAKRRSFGPHVPITGGRVRLHDVAGSWRATALVDRAELATSPEENDLVIDLPPLELFEVVHVRSTGTLHAFDRKDPS